MLNNKGTINSFGLPMTLFDSPLSILNNSSNFSPGSISPSQDKSWMSFFKGNSNKNSQGNALGGFGSPSVSLPGLQSGQSGQSGLYKYQSPLSGPKPDLLDSNKSLMPKNLPSELTPQTAKQYASKKDLGSFLGDGFNNLLKQGASFFKGGGDAAGLDKAALINMGGEFIGMGLDALGVKKMDSQNASGFDNILSGASKLPWELIPGAGLGIKAGLVGAELLNNYAGRESKKQGTSDMGYLAGYGYADINTNANTKFGFSDTVKGWFGNSKRKDTNRLTNLYDQTNTLKSVGGYYNSQNQLAANNSLSHIIQRNNQQLTGGVNTKMLVAKKGVKINPAHLRSIVKKAQKGAKLQQNTFTNWYKTVPADRNDTTNYNLKRAYELAPREELEKWRTAAPEQLKNDEYHLKTFYWNPEGIGEFVKSKKHPTIKHEIDWYYSDKAKDFRIKYDLVDDGTDYYKYKPIKEFKDGGALNVIPDGAFHSRKHNLPDEISEQVTAKGIPVVSEEDGGVLKQHAEVEKNEIIFHKKATETIENLLEQYNSANTQKEKDDLAIKCGKFIANEILVNTKDNTGLINSI